MFADQEYRDEKSQFCGDQKLLIHQCASNKKSIASNIGKAVLYFIYNKT